MAGTRFVWIPALVALAATGCQGAGRAPPGPEAVLSVGCQTTGASLPLDRGDWAVSRRTEVWKVLAEQADRPPVPVGYLLRRTYRQLRGGPEYEVYSVTTLNRREEVGRIDRLGHAWRYEPRRNTGFDEVDLGIATLEDGVAKVLQREERMVLEETSERQLAFEALDRNGSGLLEAEEVAPHGDRLRRADLNLDGTVDVQEFGALDVL